ncbi:hypothetical protein V7S43_016126 [Phytophthora oleae]|uniref:Uncharacterized protein n=1 Tax=Phytophthora oleae TaxID=2107226 RepID=A0ABD3EW68_9STRA
MLENGARQAPPSISAANRMMPKRPRCGCYGVRPQQPLPGIRSDQRTDHHQIGAMLGLRCGLEYILVGEPGVGDPFRPAPPLVFAYAALIRALRVELVCHLAS